MEENNSVELQELLSAVVDGEADAVTTARVLDALDRDAGLREAWNRLHAQRALLAHPSASTFDPEVGRRRLLAALEREPAVSTADSRPAPEHSAQRGIWGWATGAAVAASLVIAVGTGSISGNPGQNRPDVPSQIAVREAPIEFDQLTRARLLMHAQHAALTNRSGVMPAVKLAAFRSE